MQKYKYKRKSKWNCTAKEGFNEKSFIKLSTKGNLYRLLVYNKINKVYAWYGNVVFI